MNIQYPGYTSEELLDAARFWSGMVVHALQGTATPAMYAEIPRKVPPGALMVMGIEHAVLLCRMVAELRGEDPAEFARRFAFHAATVQLDPP